jgi:hypothetical protein
MQSTRYKHSSKSLGMANTRNKTYSNTCVQPCTTHCALCLFIYGHTGHVFVGIHYPYFGNVDIGSHFEEFEVAVNWK